MPEIRDDAWDCEAYGPAGRAVSALCFLARPGGRSCRTPRACHDAMTAERRRVFRRIQELAAAGDPAGLELAGYFTSPDELLGGEEEAGRRTGDA